MGETQLHFGGSAHFRDNKDLAERGDTIRYRQRPMVHSTDTRFLATPELGVTEETSYGLEAAAIHGPFHAAGEVHRLNADTIDDGASPTFFGGYRSEEHTSELQSLMRISYAVFCLKKK